MLTILAIAATAWGSLLFVAWSLARANRLEGGIEEALAFATAAPAFAMPLRETAQPIPTAGPKRTVFVVDDDPGVLELVTEVLKIQGFTVRGFTDPVEALNDFKAEHGDDDLLVTDYRMERMTGLELIKGCRVECPSLRSVVISGIREEDELARIPLESDRFLAKPFSVHALMESIDSTLALAKN
jgi:CheY-like chemotaxis protein